MKTFLACLYEKVESSLEKMKIITWGHEIYPFLVNIGHFKAFFNPIGRMI